MSQFVTTKQDAADSVMDLWDRVVALAEQVKPDDWSRPIPCLDLSVRGLVAHVATATGANGADPSAQLLAELKAAREAQAARMMALTGHQDRVLGASCLDMWVHTYDLATALDRPVDLDEDSPAVAEASRYLMRFAPQLFARGTAGEDGATLTIDMHGPLQHTATLALQGGRGLWSPDAARARDGDTVTATPAAFVLLLSGRGEPERWRDLGMLQWSGAGGAAFVHNARLFS